MKSTKYILSALFLTMGLGVMAQDEVETTVTDDIEETIEVPAKNFYHRVYAGFSAAQVDFKGKESNIMRQRDYLLKGGTIGWAGGWNISKKLPLAIEVGGEFSLGGDKYKASAYQINWQTFQVKERIDTTSTVSACALTIPVNLVYKFNIGERGLSISPFIGVRARYNIAADKELIRDEVGPAGEIISHVIKADGSLFDYKDGSANSRYHSGKRIQYGAQVGVNVDYKHFHMGLVYGRDLTENFIGHNDPVIGCYEFAKTTNSFGVNVGYNF